MEQKNIFVDLKYCIGCWSCEMACKQEHNIPVGIKWINVAKIGPRKVGDKLRMDYLPMRCRHCAKPSCLDACPENAITKRSDGIVLINPELCIGCMSCAEACPFGAVQLNEETQAAEKCTLCVQLVDQGLEPACVGSCPSKCIYFGNINEIMRDVQVQKAELIIE